MPETVEVLTTHRVNWLWFIFVTVGWFLRASEMAAPSECFFAIGIGEHLRVCQGPDFLRPSRNRRGIAARQPLIVGGGALGVGEIVRSQGGFDLLSIFARSVSSICATIEQLWLPGSFVASTHTARCSASV